MRSPSWCRQAGLGAAVSRTGAGRAGDTGHVSAADHGDALCRCGNDGCLEAAALPSIARRVRDGLCITDLHLANYAIGTESTRAVWNYGIRSPS